MNVAESAKFVIENETFHLHSLSLSPVRVRENGPEKDTG